MQLDMPWLVDIHGREAYTSLKREGGGEGANRGEESGERKKEKVKSVRI